ncbi:MAG: septum site-determining protein MinC [Pseudanabaenaceae cyanobacterium bins.68]|nr:septum site-determining protein MinC [Pseudanabaenaceae cyanobacterium bins.68]
MEEQAPQLVDPVAESDPHRPMEVQNLTDQDIPSQDLSHQGSNIQDSPELKEPDSINSPRLLQVRLKAVGQQLHLFLPPMAEVNYISPPDWSEILAQLEQRLSSGERFWSANTLVDLQAGDRLLDANQLEDLGEALTSHGLKLVRINTQRRQTAIAAAGAGLNIEQQNHLASLTQLEASAGQLLEEPLYLTLTVRSGTEINHPGTVIINGDVNAGAEITAAGDILVWGKLRGKAHAGSQGNRSAKIMALQMSATQLRIADYIARVETPSHHPEVAAVINDQICLMPVS